VTAIVLVLLVAVVLFEMRSGRRVKAEGRTGRGGRQVVVVRAPGSRWLDRLLLKLAKFVLIVALGTVAILLAPHLVKAVPSGTYPAPAPSTHATAPASTHPTHPTPVKATTAKR
jgi:hypothetical protein